VGEIHRPLKLGSRLLALAGATKRGIVARSHPSGILARPRPFTRVDRFAGGEARLAALDVPVRAQRAAQSLTGERAGPLASNLTAGTRVDRDWKARLWCALLTPCCESRQVFASAAYGRRGWVGAGANVSVVPVAMGGALLERDSELLAIDRAFARLGSGTGTVAVVEGPAGIGKSELLAAVRTGAHARGCGVLSARGSEFEGEIAFGIARQLFEPMLRGASAAERRRLLGGVARVGAGALGIEDGERPTDRFAAIHGLYWLCANRAEGGPLVLAVDDVQWADDPSLAWLGYVARRVGDVAVVLVVGLRSGDPGGERAELVRLVEDPAVERLMLGPLSAAAVGALVRAQFDDEADESFCLACWELTGGNPLLLPRVTAGRARRGIICAEEGQRASAGASSTGGGRDFGAWAPWASG
jgi:AAA ATPase domain